MSIQDLIRAGEAKITEAAQRRQAEAQAEKARNEAIAHRQFSEIIEVLKSNLPDEVMNYIDLAVDLPVCYDSEVTLRISAPECTAVSFKVGQEYDGRDGGGGYFFNHLAKFRAHDYSQDRDSYTFRVDYPFVYQDDDDGWIVSMRTTDVNDLRVALAYAHEQWSRIPALEAEAAQKQDALNAKIAAKVAAEAQAALERKSETARLLADLEIDPVAVNMLKAFLAINKERATNESRISDMIEAMEQGG